MVRLTFHSFLLCIIWNIRADFNHSFCHEVRSCLKQVQAFKKVINEAPFPSNRQNSF